MIRIIRSPDLRSGFLVSYNRHYAKLIAKIEFFTNYLISDHYNDLVENDSLRI